MATQEPPWRTRSLRPAERRQLSGEAAERRPLVDGNGYLPDGAGCGCRRAGRARLGAATDGIRPDHHCRGGDSVVAHVPVAIAWFVPVLLIELLLAHLQAEDTADRAERFVERSGLDKARSR
ncbi:hypothetical protein APR08_005659 [Nocardia amikacinitolerans]|nr:hypothetical protein [Nocardia amikacinitolerans]